LPLISTGYVFRILSGLFYNDMQTALIMFVCLL